MKLPFGLGFVWPTPPVSQEKVILNEEYPPAKFQRQSWKPNPHWDLRWDLLNRVESNVPGFDKKSNLLKEVGTPFEFLIPVSHIGENNHKIIVGRQKNFHISFRIPNPMCPRFQHRERKPETQKFTDECMLAPILTSSEICSG